MRKTTINNYIELTHYYDGAVEVENRIILKAPRYITIDKIPSLLNYLAFNLELIDEDTYFESSTLADVLCEFYGFKKPGETANILYWTSFETYTIREAGCGTEEACDKKLQDPKNIWYRKGLFDKLQSIVDELNK